MAAGTGAAALALTLTGYAVLLHGVRKDYAEAVRLFELATVMEKEPSAEALFKLGLAHDELRHNVGRFTSTSPLLVVERQQLTEGLKLATILSPRLTAHPQGRRNGPCLENTRFRERRRCHIG